MTSVPILDKMDRLSAFKGRRGKAYEILQAEACTEPPRRVKSKTDGRFASVDSGSASYDVPCSVAILPAASIPIEVEPDVAPPFDPVPNITGVVAVLRQRTRRQMRG